jgi:hypothetical protein
MGQKDVRRPKTFEHVVDPNKKFNPNSLRQTLHEIVEKNFGGNRQLASKELSKVLSRGGGSRYRQKSISARLIENIISDESYIKYWHLEVFSEYIGLPTSVLLIFSRMKANASSSKNSTDSKRLIETLKHISETVKLDMPLSVAVLDGWAEVFKPDSGPLFEGCNR